MTEDLKERHSRFNCKQDEAFIAYIVSRRNLTGNLDRVFESVLCEGVGGPFAVGVKGLLNLGGKYLSFYKRSS